MSKRHGTREQKKLAKRKNKQATRRRQLREQSSSDPALRLQGADRWPIVAALVPQALWDHGIGNLILARRTPDGQLGFAAYLVDVYCLGVKDAFWKVLSPAEFAKFRDQAEESQGEFIKVAPEHFAKLVYDAVDYAQSFGFAPHRDFRNAERLLAGIDPSRCTEDFQFGIDGRPMYIRGPHESPERAQVIAAQLAELGGDYLVPIEPDEFDDAREPIEDYDDDDLSLRDDDPPQLVLEGDVLHIRGKRRNIFRLPWKS
jgi:hypothetical protein